MKKTVGLVATLVVAVALSISPAAAYADAATDLVSAPQGGVASAVAAQVGPRLPDGKRVVTWECTANAVPGTSAAVPVATNITECALYYGDGTLIQNAPIALFGPAAANASHNTKVSGTRRVYACTRASVLYSNSFTANGNRPCTKPINTAE